MIRWGLAFLLFAGICALSGFGVWGNHDGFKMLFVVFLILASLSFIYAEGSR